ncbi:MAG: 1-deoxy-D-xylulose-5-phosphate reductoisomerase [Dehalococcoidia bacterium]|nr:1-deoxy-D-xylulose-5-phosphate reductoisomerase [Dehalococcoidia bacterium]
MDHTLTRVAVLGSTGSVGRQTLDVVRAYPDRFQVTGLAAGQNVELLLDQVAEFKPGLVCCVDPTSLRDRVDASVRVASLTEIACDPEVDVVVSAIVGKDGLDPTRAALEAGKCVALANKEAMVMAGNLLTQAARRGGGEIRPVDSEHSAVWQCLMGEDRDSVRRLILTASGGALRDLPVEALAEVSPEKALAHPTWQMGRRITVDSATLFNKGLEVIEARWLFDIPYEQIDIVLHRESIIHSMVEMVDGSLKAQLSLPDMRLPIQYALTYPERLPLDLLSVDFVKLGSLNFGRMDMERYPCLGVALAAGRKGGTYPAAIAAADEEAVAAFLDGHLRFTDIPHLLAGALDKHLPDTAASLSAIMDADAWGRRFAAEWIKEHSWT